MPNQAVYLIEGIFSLCAWLLEASMPVERVHIEVEYYLKSHKNSLHVKSKYEESPKLTQKESLKVKNPPTTTLSDRKIPELQKEFYLNTEFEEQSYIPIVKRPLPPIPPI